MEFFIWAYIEDKMYPIKVTSLHVLKDHIVYAMEGTPPQIYDNDIKALNIEWPLCRKQRSPRTNFIKMKKLSQFLSHMVKAALL
jgi:hypothetical protein